MLSPVRASRTDGARARNRGDRPSLPALDYEHEHEQEAYVTIGESAQGT